MPQKHLYDILEQQVIDPKTEFEKLDFLFSMEESCIVSRMFQPFACYVDEIFFRTLPIRGTYLSVTDMRDNLGIGNGWGGSLEQVFLFCEFLVAIIEGGRVQIIKSEKARLQANTIINNIKEILNKTNHELYAIEPMKKIIVEKNKYVAEAAEYITDETVILQTVEYNHYQLKGDLSRKRDILLSLGNYIEPLLKSKKLKESEFSSLQKDIGFVLNNFNIRHNNKDGINAKDFITQISDAELEAWYDKSYNILLSGIIISEYISIHSDITDLQRKYNL